MKVIGLISGTSSDGVDAALVDIQGDGKRIRLKLLAFEVYPYPKSIREKLIGLASGLPQPIAALCHLNFYIGERFAEAAIQIVRQAQVPLSRIELIGSHGQTVQHLPVPQREGKWSIRSTLQIGEPSIIAERTGVTTIADFRPRDMAAGGEGAPLTPYFHFLLFQNRRKSRAIVNLGGISNVTYLRAGAGIKETLAFDMGPGNMIIDGLVSALTGAKKSMDHQGRMARKGRVDSLLLSELMQHPFIRKIPPKSTGREVFGLPLIEKMMQRGSALHLSPEDLVATATAFTVTAVSENIRRFILKKGSLDEVIIGGGGVCNPVLMAQLSDSLFPLPLLTFEMLGHESRAIEAMTFALLAYQTWHHQPANIPSVTGARHPVVLGKIIPGKNRSM